MRRRIDSRVFRRRDRLPPSVPPSTRIYAVGDIHGRSDLVNSLLDRIDADLEAHPVGRSIQIFLGDYIDRGADSRSVIDRLIERQQTHETICLKGNHEALLLSFLEEPGVLDGWRRWGGLETLMSYGLKPGSRVDPEERVRLSETLARELPQSHREFFANLKTTYQCGDFFFVHAGVRPGIRLSSQVDDDLLWIRDEFLLAQDNFGKIVVHGHDPVHEPEVRANRINIDTGAYITGNLTCLVIEDDRLYFL